MQGRWLDVGGSWINGRQYKLLYFIFYYLGDYSPRLGLENEIWFKNILKWVGLNFVSASEQNLTQSHFKIFFKPNFSFKLHRTCGNSLRPLFDFILIKLKLINNVRRAGGALFSLMEELL